MGSSVRFHSNVQLEVLNPPIRSSGIAQTIDGESLEKDEKNMLKDYLVIKRFSALIKIIFLAFLDILFSYLA